MRSVTLRLNEGEYALLQAQAVAAEVSVTSHAKMLVVEGAGRVLELHVQGLVVAAQAEPAANGSEVSCLRAARHEPGVVCPLCGA